MKKIIIAATAIAALTVALASPGKADSGYVVDYYQSDGIQDSRPCTFFIISQGGQWSGWYGMPYSNSYPSYFADLPAVQFSWGYYGLSGGGGQQKWISFYNEGWSGPCGTPGAAGVSVSY